MFIGQYYEFTLPRDEAQVILIMTAQHRLKNLTRVLEQLVCPDVDGINPRISIRGAKLFTMQHAQA